jgi:hypothetical protein
MNKCKTRMSVVGMKICNYKCKTYHAQITNLPLVQLGESTIKYRLFDPCQHK